jgi:OmpA-OmpF porin, OOP family
VRQHAPSIFGIAAAMLFMSAANGSSASAVDQSDQPNEPKGTLLLAQADTGMGVGAGQSLLPGTSSGYFGISLGQPKYHTPCGAGAFECDDPDLGLHLFTGGMLNNIFGVELGYLRMGRAERAGGRSLAQGLNVSAVVRAPVAPFNLFAKGGVTYGRTEVTADALSGIPSGNESGFGASYGAGVGYDLSSRSAVILEYQRHKFHFIGTGKGNVDLLGVGYVMRF